MSYISSASLKLTNIAATNLQNDVAQQVNDQVARARTRFAPSTASNVADQTSRSDQWGTANNKANLSSSARKDVSFNIKKIDAANVQDNAATQISDQLARADSTRGATTSGNTLRQYATNSQDGSAYNKLGVSSHAKWTGVDIKDISAINQQSNAATQVNTQKAISSTLGWDPASNGAWQTATSWQGGSAYNNINVNV